MVSIDSCCFFTICLSTLFLIIVLEKGTEGAVELSHPDKAHLIQNPYFSSIPEGNYQDNYETPSQFDSVWKRAPSVGFYGVRGKKAPSTNFYGMRGKKGPVGFLGMRGKKMEGGQRQPVNSDIGVGRWGSKPALVGLSNDEKVRGEESVGVAEGREGVDSEQAWGAKRVPSQGFMGLRGKRELNPSQISVESP